MAAKAPNPGLYREVTWAALLGLVVNVALGAAKLVGGVVSGSVALLSDALNSVGDVFTSLVVLFGLRVAQLEPDEEHPYGHTRAETIAASNVALFIILSALVIAAQAISRLGQPHETPPGWTLWLAGANVAIKEALYRYKIRVGRRAGSQSIVTDAWDHRNDALSSLAVLIALAAIRWGGPKLEWADTAGALVVVGFIIWTGVGLFRSSLSELMDAQAPAELVAEIRQTARGVSGVADVEKLWVRKSGLEYFADIHIEVDPQMTVAQGHDIGHQVKDHLLAKFDVLRDVLVHLEPARCDERAAS